MKIHGAKILINADDLSSSSLLLRLSLLFTQCKLYIPIFLLVHQKDVTSLISSYTCLRSSQYFQPLSLQPFLLPGS